MVRYTASPDVILKQVQDYYTEKVQTHGASAKGVDWKNEESQYLRFRKLAEIIKEQQDFSINDLGCGYGAFVSYLDDHYSAFDYRGVDLSNSMIEEANKSFGDRGHCTFIQGASFPEQADYTVASGIFNVRLSTPIEDWQAYVINTLDMMCERSLSGFSFNCLTSYSDSDRMRSDLYYADPCFFFDYCKRHYSSRVSLIHDYELYEFTVLVRVN